MAVRKEVVYEEETPRQSLERILRAEIEIAEEISTARDKAKKLIEESNSDFSSIKEKTIEKAREDREEMHAKGIAAAHAEAEKKIEKAKSDSERFEKSGSKYIEGAVQETLSLILGGSGDSRQS